MADGVTGGGAVTAGTLGTGVTDAGGGATGGVVLDSGLALVDGDGAEQANADKGATRTKRAVRVDMVTTGRRTAAYQFTSKRRAPRAASVSRRATFANRSESCRLGVAPRVEPSS